MNIFDIMGPIMVGPSSSHTAGAVRIGKVSRHLLGGQPAKAEILFHGSFAATGTGHGTDRAIVAGLLDMSPDDINIPQSFSLAEKAGMQVEIKPAEIQNAHPNTAVLNMTAADGSTLSVQASSLGGGRIKINAIDGMEASFSGDSPTLIIRNEDRPGMVAKVSKILTDRNVNIATMQLYRDRRGGLAVMVIEFDEGISPEIIDAMQSTDGIIRCTYLDMRGA